MDILKEKFVIVDLETTGLDTSRDFIIEIGAAKIENGIIADTFSSFVSNLQMQHLPENITALTGITDADLKNAPPIHDVLLQLKDFMSDHTLVAHNLRFDFAFLLNWGFQCGVDFEPFANNAIDTIEYAKGVLGNKVKNYKLSTLAEYFGIKFAHHRALTDALATAEVFIRLATFNKK